MLTDSTLARIRDLCAEILTRRSLQRRLEQAIALEVERAGLRFGFTPYEEEREHAHRPADPAGAAAP